GGVGRDFLDGAFSFWFSNGEYSVSDQNGGALVLGSGWPSFTSKISALGSIPVASLHTFGPPAPGSFGTICVAVFLTGNNPPPVIPEQPVPQSLQRWRGQVGLNWLGMALVGDAFSNVVGLSDFDNFTEYGNTMRMLVTTPPLQDDRKRIFFPR